MYDRSVLYLCYLYLGPKRGTRQLSSGEGAVWFLGWYGTVAVVRFPTILTIFRYSGVQILSVHFEEPPPPVFYSEPSASQAAATNPRETQHFALNLASLRHLGLISQLTFSLASCNAQLINQCTCNIWNGL